MVGWEGKRRQCMLNLQGTGCIPCKCVSHYIVSAYMMFFLITLMFICSKYEIAIAK